MNLHLSVSKQVLLRAGFRQPCSQELRQLLHLLFLLFIVYAHYMFSYLIICNQSHNSPRLVVVAKKIYIKLHHYVLN